MASRTENPLLTEAVKTAEVIGIENTTNLLRKARVVITDEHVNKIIKNITQQTGVSYEQIIYGTEKTDERKIAVSLCVYFIKNQLHYSYSKIKRFIPKDNAALSRYYRNLKTLDMNNPRGFFNKQLLSHYKALELIFKG